MRGASRHWDRDDMTPEIKAELRSSGFNFRQALSFARLCRRMGPPCEIGMGFGREWVFARWKSLYIGIEKDGYVHS